MALHPPVGIIANPASGKDIRRLVAHASVFDNAEKSNIVRRVLLGALAAGAREFLYMADGHGLVERALDGLTLDGARCTAVATPGTASALDTARAAEAMQAAGCGVVVTLGGDGTNRALALGWRDTPLIAISTGTNNVFPQLIEGSVAGAAAGLVATGAVALDLVAHTAKRVLVEIEGERPDLALIDVVLVRGQFVGARAMWDAADLRLAVLARGEPAAVGIAAVGGLLDPVSAADDGGLSVVFGGGGCRVRAPIAPGLFEDVPIRRFRRLQFGEAVAVEGPGVLALDGERERPLRRGQRAVLSVLRDGPRLIDVRATLTLAARRGIFRSDPSEGMRERLRDAG